MDQTNEFGLDWDAAYSQNRHMSVWPWSDLVSLVMRYARPRDKCWKVLELGCGAGANIPFFTSLNVDYYSVESSKVAVSMLHERYPQLEKNIFLGDFTKELPNEFFDLIVDRGSVVCNSTDAISECLTNCRERLNRNGIFIGVDWYSTKCSDYFNSQIEDEWTRVNFNSGPFEGVPRIHFSDKNHLCDLFSAFEFRYLEHKSSINELAIHKSERASWNFVVSSLE